MMRGILIYIFLTIFLKINAIKCIINKIIDIKNININKYTVYDSIFFVSFDEFIKQKNKYANYAVNNNFLYVYKTENKFPFSIDFLMVKYSYNNEMPIITSVDKYFKPFQYTIYDIHYTIH